ncbi:hypothetical protein TRIATDRAFT_91473 [Trichoderma atroviride IMI 206040]|uniref:Uncharacterized protein n=1 Tax=Hypocrea atroviridis (strain ATCC 20476 / IMI 206040) TaxID=452589 RepID=G9NM32_HYPAI|nr:uncharacterized protein TRIATDRAFT_91473 [Trichoderma atroviride IMI 206040]EHK47964.1 hypothetical protein TRIATDRAFT_91473 [Trichoderma atroviride IMI 206040]
MARVAENSVLRNELYAAFMVNELLDRAAITLNVGSILPLEFYAHQRRVLGTITIIKQLHRASLSPHTACSAGQGSGKFSIPACTEHCSYKSNLNWHAMAATVLSCASADTASRTMACAILCIVGRRIREIACMHASSGMAYE